MKTSGKVKSLMIASGVMLGTLALSASEYRMTYRHYSEHGDVIYNSRMMGCKPKAERIKDYAGSIFVDYDEAMSVEMLTCARVAVEIWESEIRTNVPVRIKMIYDSLENPEDGEYVQTTAAEVAFVYDEEEGGLSYPASLHKQLTGEDREGYDAVITINRDIPFEDWCFTHTPAQHIYGKYDLTSAVMIAIGNALGIGSSIEYDGELPLLALPSLTPYDTLISFGINKKSTLSDLNLVQGQPSAELAAMLEKFPELMSGTQYYRNLSSGRIFSSPGINFSTPSGVCLFDGISGKMHQNVDAYIIGALKTMGWPVGKASVGIYPVKDSTDTGILKTNDFWYYIQDSRHYMSSHEVNVDYHRKDGSVLTKGFGFGWGESTLGFELPDEEEMKELEINVNGDIYGYASGWVRMCKDNASAEPTDPILVNYRLSIQQAPSIISHRLVNTGTQSSPHYYLLVTYTGADFIAVRLTDSEGGREDMILDSPYNAAVPLPDYDSEKKYTVGMMVSNSKGVTTSEVIIPSGEVVDPAGADSLESDVDKWTRMEVYDMNGRLAGVSVESLPKGVYAVVYFNGDAPVARKKIIR